MAWASSTGVVVEQLGRTGSMPGGQQVSRCVVCHVTGWRGPPGTIHLDIPTAEVTFNSVSEVLHEVGYKIHFQGWCRCKCWSFDKEAVFLSFTSFTSFVSISSTHDATWNWILACSFSPSFLSKAQPPYPQDCFQMVRAI